MNKKEKEELGGMTKDQLAAKAAETAKQIRTARLEHATRKGKNTRQMKMLRKKHAVILTFLRQRELADDNRKGS